MHENQQTKEATETQDSKKGAHRPYQFYVLVNHRQLDMEGKVTPSELLSFENKSALRAGLENPRYESAQLRIFRGYEMKVKAKRHISIN